MFGFYRIAVAVPRVRVADVEYNTAATTELFHAASHDDVALIIFPELGLTSYTCADLFHQQSLLMAARDGINRLCEETRGHSTVAVVGAPLHHRNAIYNCGVVIQAGEIKGIVPKSYLPSYREYYEKRFFASGIGVVDSSIDWDGTSIPWGTDLLFDGGSDVVIGVELCEDLWHPLPPSSGHSLAGATVIANLSASNELVAKAQYRTDLVRSQSGRCVAAYAYASCGVWESTTDVVFSGHALIAENGALVAENKRFSRQPTITTADVDCQRLRLLRVHETSFADSPPPCRRRVTLKTLPSLDQLRRHIDPHPFVPARADERECRCREIFDIQAAGLAKRLEHTGAEHAIIGLSGGLDSTLAVLVTCEAFRLLERPPTSVLGVTMPGFGTSERTRNNVLALADSLNIDIRQIDITDACTQHFAAIGHDPTVHDRTYENVQARERTQLLMDIANAENGIVIGTGDLSEIALGWSTYNGDHMAMYNVNASVPKTLIRYVIAWVADGQNADIAPILHDILATPVSPELLPLADDGSIAQETESVVGPYELHDFFLYHSHKYGATPAKIHYLATLAFPHYSADTVKTWLQLFIRRFFSQQFKRSCMPDGPKVGTISLSPRGDWRMPSDAVPDEWLRSFQ